MHCILSICMLKFVMVSICVQRFEKLKTYTGQIRWRFKRKKNCIFAILCVDLWKKTAIQQWPFVTKIWVLLKRTSVKYWLYYCYIYIYAKSTKYYIIHITILLYYSSYYTILYKYYFITKYHIYIYIIIHISYPADRNCAPKRRNNAYFGVIRSCLICVDSASDDFGPF